MRATRYGRDKRTGKDRRNDLVMFLGMARPEMIARETPESLAARYNVPVKIARELMKARR